MSIATSSITTSSQLSGLSLVQGTSQAQNVSLGSVTQALQGPDEAKVSEAGKNMSQLQKLATSDPEKFKAVTQKISDSLAKAAKDSGDSNQSAMLTDLSQKFADAAKNGSMDSLQFQKPGQLPGQASGQMTDGSASATAGAMKFASGQQNPMEIVSNAVSSALSDTSAS